MINHRRPNFIIRTQLNHGLIAAICTVLRLHGHETKQKIYVQHRLKEHGAEVWEWFENGAYFYICGDKTYMAKDVHRALVEIAIEHGGMSKLDRSFH